MFSLPCLSRRLAALTLVVALGGPASLFALRTVPLVGSWTDAVKVVALPDGSLLVAQRSGLVDRLAPDGEGFREPAPWADLGDNGADDLLGLAVDPEFLSSGYIYATLRSTKDGQPVVRLTRWRDSGGLVVLNRVLVDDLPAGHDRAGGVLSVGPDEKLWVGLGDGGVPASEVKAENLRGVLLRYEKTGDIPADNPDPRSPVWAKGLRDPSGLAWQPGTDRLYALDRGPVIPKGTMDELNMVERGADFGWPKHLGRETVKGVVKPIIYCSSGHSWVPGGGTFLTQGEWKGSLLFAGSGEGVLYRISLDTKAPTRILFYEELVGGSLGPLVDVGLGTDDQPYLLSKERLYKLVP